MLATVAVGLVVAALVRGFVLESYVVPSAAFAPTFEPGDRVLVLKTDRSADAGRTTLVEERDGTLRLVPSVEAEGAGGQVVGTVVWRFWPLGRLGSVGAASPEATAAPVGSPS
ncbi:hypothetical protein ATL31_0668 [Phycicoccus duodecadis]|uniref:Peptidase S26 domain-containing protein n=1 Tax=Phycicoccus duodecadis TaxID=173053 RepID=A0A2N3YGB8_9MICO|nr:hypothetical protein ATL31_0668 [Phycicoccus duodecadis]